MQYISLINLLKASLAYGKRLTICVQCTLMGLVSGYHKRPEVSYTVASMTISIDAKCYYVLVFIRSRSTWGPSYIYPGVQVTPHPSPMKGGTREIAGSLPCSAAIRMGLVCMLHQAETKYEGIICHS